jgi:hypothetical protein
MAGRAPISRRRGPLHSVTVLVAAAVAATVLETVALGIGPAAALTLGTGTFTCSSASGEITYSPAWTDIAKHRVRATVNVTFAGCGGGSPAPTSVTLSKKLNFPNGRGSCSNGYYVPATFKANYSPVVKKSKVTVPGNGLFIVGLGGLRTGGFATTGSTPFVVSGSYATTAVGPSAIITASGIPTGNCVSGVTATTIRLGEFDSG